MKRIYAVAMSLSHVKHHSQRLGIPVGLQDYGDWHNSRIGAGMLLVLWLFGAAFLARLDI